MTRVPVVFESDAGARAFTNSVAERYDDGGADLRVGSVRKWGRNAYFNRQVNVADADNDGIISDYEVTSYSSAH